MHILHHVNIIYFESKRILMILKHIYKIKNSYLCNVRIYFPYPMWDITNISTENQIYFPYSYFLPYLISSIKHDFNIIWYIYYKHNNIYYTCYDRLTRRACHKSSPFTKKKKIKVLKMLKTFPKIIITFLECVWKWFYKTFLAFLTLQW